MRYLTITYVKRPNGQLDEQVQVSNKLRERDLTTCNIILDFKEKKVEKCVIEGVRTETHWDTMYGYYQQIYPAIFERLEREASEETPE
jgi:hypothetical protein